MSDKKLAQVFHYDLYGKREEKYEFLEKETMNSLQWNDLKVKEPNLTFNHNDELVNISYSNGFSISEILMKSSSGIETRKDYLVISFNSSNLTNIIQDFLSLDQSTLASKYNINNDSRDWKIDWAINDLKSNNPQISSIAYKPFDIRKTIYTGKTKGIIGYPMYENFRHILNKNNIGIIIKRGRLLGSNSSFTHVGISNNLVDKNYLADLSYFFPLYLYPESAINQINEENLSRIPNLNMNLVQQLVGLLGLTFIPEKETSPGTFAPIDLLDYIYAILHSPTYRQKYKEFLKIDFPRIPYPKDQETFWKFVKLGGELRQIHLLESPVVERFITTYPVSGNNEVGKVKYEYGKVRINETQYFDRVPQVAWEFYIGGYQPAQKWLKDRKGRQLSFEDVRHYQKIIVALTETDRIMKEIDQVEFE